MRPVLFGLTAVLGLVALHARSADAPANGVEASPPRTVISPYSPNAAVEAATKALDSAQATAAKAERDLNRQRNLKASDAATQSTVDDAQAKFDSARAARDAADAELRRALKEATANGRYR